MEHTEWKKLDSLRKELNANIMAYDSYAQEKFTSLLVKSLEGKGDPFPPPFCETKR
jgi:hypothetical protein